VSSGHWQVRGFAGGTELHEYQGGQKTRHGRFGGKPKVGPGRGGVNPLGDKATSRKKKLINFEKIFIETGG